MGNHKNEITYHNKDVLSKILAENFKDKSLKVYGIDVPKIKQILPTNLPQIQVNEMRIDNLFLLEDDSIAIIDYESDVKWENHLKYLNYIVRILERYKKEEMPKQIRMIVIYTADVEKATKEFSAGCLTLKMEQAFLSKIDSETVQEEIREKLEHRLPLSDDELMKLIILHTRCEYEIYFAVSESIILSANTKIPDNTNVFSSLSTIFFANSTASFTACFFFSFFYAIIHP